MVLRAVVRMAQVAAANDTQVGTALKDVLQRVNHACQKAGRTKPVSFIRRVLDRMDAVVRWVLNRLQACALASSCLALSLTIFRRLLLSTCSVSVPSGVIPVAPAHFATFGVSRTVPSCVASAKVVAGLAAAPGSCQQDQACRAAARGIRSGPASVRRELCPSKACHCPGCLECLAVITKASACLC